VVRRRLGRDDGRDDVPVRRADGRSLFEAHEVAIADGASFSHTFMQPGTYVYYCTIHGSTKAGMVGRIVVTAP